MTHTLSTSAFAHHHHHHHLLLEPHTFKQKMIVLALVAKSSHILAETHDPAHDRFLPAAQTILSRIPPNSSKLSYAFEDWLFHYVSQDGLVYMAVADTDTGRRIPFTFLAHLQKKVRSPPLPPLYPLPLSC